MARIIKGFTCHIWPNSQEIVTESSPPSVYLRGDARIPNLQKGDPVELEMRDGKIGRGWISRADAL